MLEDLDKVDWANIHHSHGTAEKFPQWIRDLASANKKTRNDALEKLWEYSYHQQTLYNVTPHIIPFIIELLQYDVSGKDSLLNMLTNFSGHVYDQYGEGLYMTRARNSPDSVYYQQQEKLGIDCFKAVLQGISQYLSHLHHSKSKIRITSVHLLSQLIQEKPDVGAALRTQILLESDPKVIVEMIAPLRGSIVNNHAIPNSERQEFLKLFEKLFNAFESDLLRFHAAILAIQMVGDFAPTEMISVIGNAIVQPEKYVMHRLDQVKISMVVSDVCESLSQVSSLKIVPLLIERLSQMKYPEAAHEVAIMLLDLAFFGKRREVTYGGTPEIRGNCIYYGNLPKDYVVDRPKIKPLIERYRGRLYHRLYPRNIHALNVESLSAEQRTALRAVLNAEVVWMLHSNLLEIYGLPPFRQEAYKLINSADF
jgi:hypothetical protein